MGAPRVLRSAVAHLEKGDWQAAHAIVQKDEDSPLSCWAHGIVHVMEGDLANARYWYREAKRAFPEGYSVPDEIAALKAAIGSDA
jgi:hypothetical protein